MDVQELIRLNRIAFRLTSLKASVRSLQAYLLSSGQTSEQLQDEFSLEGVTWGSLLLMMEVLQSWQFAAHMYLLKSESTDLQTLNDLQRTWLTKLKNEGFFGDLPTV